ncbi:N-(5'-phosphoribosyl)anthranilate isomerase [Croceicoccus estronivorus]|uniref:phosphoribosylanthranilate isomerase n=1 Tax=Croceicoccus estronivorus TaxID=1172626 RepID=UPI00082CDFEF|nr:phosphoribosylanthranilate isomerase [Croceicoccus estronivorus]OCC23067.1 N-(5'-phosphoribosyl)anthranilate isomerase [Croceicoccus estronivorus]
MAPPKIKICGITSSAALDACIRAQADFVGFVFYAPSPRNLTPSDAAELAAQVGTRAKKVGLFVNADDLEIAEGVQAGRLDIIQLHGSESPERTAQIKTRFGLPVWKALPVASAYDVERALQYREIADLILFDAKTPKGALPGGMGLAFDWSLLAGYSGTAGWGLAGGLTPENVGEAIRITGTTLVDTSSGVESAPGVKDVDRIAAFCNAARSQ